MHIYYENKLLSKRMLIVDIANQDDVCLIEYCL